MHCHTAKQMRGSVTHEAMNLKRLAIIGQRDSPSGRNAKAKIPQQIVRLSNFRQDLADHEANCSDCERERFEKNG